MNIKELKTFLKSHLVPKKLYKIGKEKKNRICIEKENENWIVFFKDKKDKIGTLSFSNENDACMAFIKEIKKIMEGMYEVTFFEN